MRQHVFKWHNEETGEHVAETTADTYAAREEPDCPLCGKPTVDWEGVIDQDEMGNDLHGCNWVCDLCHIGTQLEYLD